jgi:hypothetical protein
MTAENRACLTSFLSHVQELLDIQEAATKAKRSGNSTVVRSKSNEFQQVKEKITALLPGCKAILSADQTSLF